MEQVNPGLAKGYALDFASPLRFVAEALHARPRSLDDLVDAYEHDREDLARVWDHELRARGQRRSAREDVQREREAEARRWLVEAAIGALGAQVRERDGRLSLSVPLEEVRVQGLPVVMPVGASDASSDAEERPRARRGARPGRTAPAPAPEPEPPPPPHLLRAWMERQGYTERRLARALDVDPSEVAAYLADERAAPRVVWLALWALERGAEV